MSSSSRAWERDGNSLKGGATRVEEEGRGGGRGGGARGRDEEEGCNELRDGLSISHAIKEGCIFRDEEGRGFSDNFPSSTSEVRPSASSDIAVSPSSSGAVASAGAPPGDQNEQAVRPQEVHSEDRKEGGEELFATFFSAFGFDSPSSPRAPPRRRGGLTAIRLPPLPRGTLSRRQSTANPSSSSGGGDEHDVYDERYGGVFAPKFVEGEWGFHGIGALRGCLYAPRPDIESGEDLQRQRLAKGTTNINFLYGNGCFCNPQMRACRSACSQIVRKEVWFESRNFVTPLHFLWEGRLNM